MPKNLYRLKIMQQLINKILFLISILTLIWVFNTKYADWSELNLIVAKKCIDKSIVKNTCEINFHELNFEWDDLYYLSGTQQSYIDILFKKNTFRKRDDSDYLVFLKNKEIIQIYEHYKNVFGEPPTNKYNAVLLVPNWKRGSASITHCKNNFLLERIFDYEDFKKYKRIVYGISCSPINVLSNHPNGFLVNQLPKK